MNAQCPFCRAEMQGKPADLVCLKCGAPGSTSRGTTAAVTIRGESIQVAATGPQASAAIEAYRAALKAAQQNQGSHITVTVYEGRRHTR